MDYSATISKILGEHTQEQGAVADRVLSYVAENPGWKDQEVIIYKSKVLNALDRALVQAFGHDLAFYSVKDRHRELTEVRYLCFLLLREESACSLNEIGKVFGKNHTTVLYGVQAARDLTATYTGFARDYERLKELFKEQL